MAIPVKASKDRIQHLLDCIAQDKEIKGARSVEDFLLLAGVCHCTVMTHGTAPWLTMMQNLDALPPEHREAGLEDLTESLNDAIEFYSQVAMSVLAGTYDEKMEPTFSAILSRDGEQRQVHPVEGWKQSE